VKRLSARETRRMQEQMIKRMGMKMDEVPEVDEVLIRTRGKVLRIEKPQVTRVELQGQTFFQVVGNPVEEPPQPGKPPELPEEDVLLVAQQAGCGVEEARRALLAANGDLAQAILILKSARP